jgi:hypothetical protein
MRMVIDEWFDSKNENFVFEEEFVQSFCSLWD